MKISAVVEQIKHYYHGLDWNGHAINPEHTRDNYLFGDPDQTCTGIVTTCFASYEVIEKAIEKGANLIIPHEALFWNRGDKTEWLKDNSVYHKKEKLLKQHNIVVWRNHDYIHTGIPTEAGLSDGIFYGVMKKLEWEGYQTGDLLLPMNYLLPEMSAEDVAKHLVEKLNLNGLRLIGDPQTKISKLHIPLHVMGDDNDKITYAEKEEIDGLVALEVIDYTLSEYVRDAAYSGTPKVIFSVGHFNLEEVGMEYMLTYLPEIVGAIPCYFVQSGDSFHYYTVNNVF